MIEIMTEEDEKNIKLVKTYITRVKFLYYLNLIMIFPIGAFLLERECFSNSTGLALLITAMIFLSFRWLLKEMLEFLGKNPDLS
jgi:hypothetical protein